MTVNTDTMIVQCLVIKLTPHEAHQLWLGVSPQNNVARHIEAKLKEYCKATKVFP